MLNIINTVHHIIMQYIPRFQAKSSVFPFHVFVILVVAVIVAAVAVVISTSPYSDLGGAIKTRLS